MKKTISFQDFRNEFKYYGRENQFTEEALAELFNMFEELEELTGKEIELDVIAICCDWTEYRDLNDFWANGWSKDKYPTIETIEEKTFVMETELGSFLAQNF